MLFLFSKGYGSVFGIHRIDNCERFEMITEVTYNSSADLESLFDNNTQTLDGSAGAFGNRNKSLQSASVCKKIVNDQNVIVFASKALRNNDVVFIFVCKGFDLCDVHIAVYVNTLGFFCEYNGYIKISCDRTGDSDTG